MCYYSSLGKIVICFWLKTQLFYLFYISCSLTLVVCGKKNISPNLTNSLEPEAEPELEPELEPLEKKNDEPEPSGIRVAKKNCDELK